MHLKDGLRPDPAEDAETLTLAQWSKEQGYDGEARGYDTKEPVVRAMPGAHPGTHRAGDDEAA